MTIKPCAAALLAALSVPGFLLPAPAWADDADHYTLEEVQACSGDAIQYCGDVLTDNHKIEACMRAHKTQLSPACQAMFDRTGH